MPNHIARGFVVPKKTIIAYKQFRTLKNSPGKIFPLFIGKGNPTPVGVWIEALFIPTAGFAKRPGWHAGVLPLAPHLRSKKLNSIAPDRVWAEVEIPADVDWQKIADKEPRGDIQDKVPAGGYYKFKTSKMQGGAWIIGGALKVNKILSNSEVKKILVSEGYASDAKAEMNPNPKIFDQFKSHMAVQVSDDGFYVQDLEDVMSESFLENPSFIDSQEDYLESLEPMDEDETDLEEIPEAKEESFDYSDSSLEDSEESDGLLKNIL